MRSISLFHDHVRTGMTQRFGPYHCIVKKERLVCARHEVDAWKLIGHTARRFIAASRRCAEHHTVGLGMAQPESKRQLSTRRDTQHCGAFSGQRHAEFRLHPTSHILDEELLVRREAFWFKARRILMESQRLIA